MKHDKFWYDNPGILFQQNRLAEFFPDIKMNLNEKLNSLTRLLIYIGMVLYFYNNNYLYLFIGIIGIIITYSIYYIKLNNSIIKDKYYNYKNKKINYIKPTKNNPFMNILLNEYGTKNNREALIKKNINDKSVKKMIDNKFNINLYKNIDDIYNLNNSQRQYYTNPITTIPNDQNKFAKWLYNTGPTCKEKTINCSNNIYTSLKANSLKT